MLRAVLLMYRYVGIATCLCFAMWFVSGMMMMYVGFPQLTDVERFSGLAPLDLRTAHVLPALAAAGVEGWPRAVRLEMVFGRPAYIVHSWEGPVRTVFADDGSVLHHVAPADAIAAVQQFTRVSPDARLTRITALHAYDFYWYAHHEPRLLPVLRVTFDDPQATWFHIDPVTGDVLERMDASRRWHRILFNALHSLDFPILLAYLPAWDLAVIALCGLGLALSVTAVVIAWRRLQTAWRSSG